MQITIKEEEIKAAIVAYLNNMMTIREGSNIDIDFRATRGEAGTMAIIDITPNANASQVSKPQVRQAVATAAYTHRDELVSQDAKDEAPEASNQEKQETASTEDGGTTMEASTEDNMTVVPMKQPEAQTDQPKTDAPQAASGGNKRSLFSGLKSKSS